jgi:hypothetical protein
MELLILPFCSLVFVLLLLLLLLLLPYSPL